MLGSEIFLPNRQRPMIERLGLGVVALGSNQSNVPPTVASLVGCEGFYIWGSTLASPERGQVASFVIAAGFLPGRRAVPRNFGNNAIVSSIYASAASGSSSVRHSSCS